MAQLTEQQLLLLDNLLYSDEILDAHGGKLGEFVDELLQSQDYGRLSGDYASKDGKAQFAEILAIIQNDDQLRNLTIGESTRSADLNSEALANDEITATCFIDSDNNAIVAFRGTGGKVDAWCDNFTGMYKPDTELQEESSDYMSHIIDKKYDSITVTGHSKGGNLAMYNAVVNGYDIDRCVSFDGQGFPDDYFPKYRESINDNRHKIKNISAYNDFVNPLLHPIGTKEFVNNEGGEGFSAGHSSYWLYMTNKDKWHPREQSDFAKIEYDMICMLEKILPEDDLENTADFLGLIAGYSQKNDSEDYGFVDFLKDLGPIIKRIYEQNAYSRMLTAVRVTNLLFLCGVTYYVASIYEGLKELFDLISEKLNVGDYSQDSPHIKVNTETLVIYSGKLNNLATRINNVSESLGSLYLAEGYLDIYDLYQSTTLTDMIFMIQKCSSYLSETAQAFDDAEDEIKSIFS